MKHQSKSYKVQVEDIKSFIHIRAGISSSWLCTREKTHLHSLYKICQAGWSREHHLPIQPKERRMASDIKCTILEVVMSTSHLQAN